MVLWLAGFPNSWSDCSHLGQAVESPFQHITLNALPFNLSANPETVWHCLSWDTRFSTSPKALSSFWLRMGYCLHPSFQSFSSTTRVWAGRNANWHRTGTQRTLVRRLSVPSHLLALVWPTIEPSNARSALLYPQISAVPVSSVLARWHPILSWEVSSMLRFSNISSKSGFHGGSNRLNPGFWCWKPSYRTCGCNQTKGRWLTRNQKLH